MSNIGLNCDVCGRIVQGCTFVNGMKFCAKCYQETFGNNYSQTDIINAQYTEHLLKENAQLKEKFEILEQENKQLEEQHNLLIDEFQKQREDLCKQIKQESDARKRFVEKVKQLKERLVEKDKTIEQLRKNMEFDTAYYIKELVNIRKQVCEEVKDVIVCHSVWNEQCYIINMVTEDLLKEIDIIKQPKENV